MAKRRDRFEEQRDALRRCLETAPAEEVLVALREVLKKGTSTLVAEAAKAIRERRLTILTPELEAAFPRFLENPVKADPACLAKTAIVRALLELEQVGTEVYLAGVRHVQLEPSFGPPIDTAENLRALCLNGLAQAGYSKLRDELILRLVDPELMPRLAAVAILERLGAETDRLLLQLLVLRPYPGDDSLQGEALAALLRMDPDHYLPFAVPYLDDPELGETTALAIAESRHPEAAGILLTAWDTHLTPSHRRTLVLPLALTRDAAAADLLLDHLATARGEFGAALVEALWLCFPAPTHRERVQQTVLANGDDSLLLAWRKAAAGP